MGRCPLIARFVIKGCLSALFPLPREVTAQRPKPSHSPSTYVISSQSLPTRTMEAAEVNDGGGSFVKLRRIISFATLGNIDSYPRPRVKTARAACACGLARRDCRQCAVFPGEGEPARGAQGVRRR